MTIRIEQETEVPFDFDYCTLAKETVVCSLDQEAFPAMMPAWSERGTWE